MANVKISELPAATIPLAGTEEMPVVQGGVTKRTAINNILNANTIPYIANGLGAAATPSYTFTGDLNTGMWSPAADTLAFSEGGAEAMRIDSSGNVGIGTSSPGTKLDVQGSGSVIVRSRSTDTSGVTVGVLAAEHGSGGSLQVRAGFNFTNLVSTGATDPIIFSINSTEKMRIDSSGNVGIGTTAPTAKLDVLGDFVARTNASGGNSPLNVKNDSTASNTTKTTSLLFQGTDTVGTGKNVGLVQCGPSDANYVASYLAFQTRTADVLAEKMRIDTNGSVGIGTSSPDASALLDVSSTTKGFLPPRMSTAQRDAIGGATQEGLILYNVTTDKLQVFAAGAWVNLH
jgi:hypothetical protein